MNISVSERFYKFVEKTPTCCLWTGSHKGRGYGSFYLNGKKKRAHRVAWMINKGEIPEGLNVLHECDNPLCVRPDHLFLGTQSDNMKDAFEKGRLNQEDLVKNGRVGAQAFWDRLSPAERSKIVSERARKRWDGISPTERSEYVKKGWITRRKMVLVA